MMRKVCLTALSLFVMGGLAFAQEKKAGETKEASGTVKAVSASSLTIVKGTDEWTFAVDKETRVVARGGTRKAEEAKEAGKGVTITEIVKEKQSVTVKYHDMGGGKLHAAEVRVR